MLSIVHLSVWLLSPLFLQASKSSLSEPAKLASQLAASLTTAQSLASSLSQGQQQLLRAQSIGGATSDARRCGCCCASFARAPHLHATAPAAIGCQQGH